MVAEFTKLRAWQLSAELAADVYEMTSGFPPGERYGMGQQSRRAAVSMSSNIAEGYARLHPRDKARFYELARSPCADEACRVIYGLMEATRPSL